MDEKPNFLGWDTDEITGQTEEQEEAPPNVVQFTLQAEIATPVISPKPVRESPRPQNEPYPWSPAEDEAFRSGCYRRSWRCATRKEWNSQITNIDGIVCRVCGYKWHKLDIMEDGSCFNCWMIDNKPAEVARFWSGYSTGGGQKHGETAPPKLVKLDDGKGK